jgi:hypothetical protein
MVKQGATYQVRWNDSFQGSGKSADIQVSANYKEENGSIFYHVDSGYNTPQSFTATKTGIVLLTVERYTGGNTTGTFAVMYTKTAEGSIPFVPPISPVITLTAPEGYAGYQWIINNELSLDTGNSIEIPGSDLPIGPNSITLVVFKFENGVTVPYSKELTFTVLP